MNNSDRYVEASNYYSDRRVRAGERAADSPIRRIDTGRMLALVVLEGDDGEEEHEVPVRFEVCSTCAGKGTHVNPSIDAGGLTAEDFAEDPDFADSYLDGHYDVGCYGCGGERVVPVIDTDRADPEIVKRIDQYHADAAAYRAECAAERRFGC